jgi:hypothetical protein
MKPILRSNAELKKKEDPGSLQQLERLEQKVMQERVKSRILTADNESYLTVDELKVCRQCVLRIC